MRASQNIANGRINDDHESSHITEDCFHAAAKFIHACDNAGLARLRRGERAGVAGFYLSELAAQLAASIEALVREGDVQLARQLQSVVERLSAAQARYGMKVSARFTKRNTISALLKKHPAKELLAMVFAKEPELDKVMHWLRWTDIKAMPEEKLRALLLSTVVSVPGGKPEPQQLAAHIVRFFDLGERNFERPNINLFVEHLQQGILWSGPGKTFEKCPWHDESDKLPRSDTIAWTKRIKAFLVAATENDPNKLIVFRNLLARRRAVYARSSDRHERLSNDDPTYAWSVVMKEIREAWGTLARKARSEKRTAHKPKA